MSDYLIKLRFMYSFNCMVSCDKIKGMPGSRAYLKGVSHLFNPVCPFLLRRPKEMDERKGRRCAELVATELSHLLRRIAKVCAYKVSAFGWWFRYFFSHSSFSVVLCILSLISVLFFCHPCGCRDLLMSYWILVFCFYHSSLSVVLSKFWSFLRMQGSHSVLLNTCISIRSVNA